jgi:hypothetical protein
MTASGRHEDGLTRHDTAKTADGRGGMRDILRWVRHLAVLAMTVIAFANSYSHTVVWFQENGQEGTAHALAALPEVGLLVALLFLLEPLDRAGRFLVGALGVGSLALTVTANLSHATDDVTRLAAIVAPAFTVFCAALEIRSILGHKVQPLTQTDPVEVSESQEPDPVDPPLTQADPDPVSADPAPVGADPADRVAWISRQAVTPTLTQLIEVFGYSDSAAKRDLRAAKALTHPPLRAVND